MNLRPHLIKKKKKKPNKLTAAAEQPRLKVWGSEYTLSTLRL